MGLYMLFAGLTVCVLIVAGNLLLILRPVHHRPILMMMRLLSTTLMPLTWLRSMTPIDRIRCGSTVVSCVIRRNTWWMIPT